MHRRDGNNKGKKKLYDEEIHNLHSSINIITIIEWKKTRVSEHRVLMKEIKTAYKNSVGKPKGKIDLGVGE